MLSRAGLVFVHSSDERYGADRLLLALVSAVPAGIAVEVWLPTDRAHPDAPLCELLEQLGVDVRHVRLPILRRAYGHPSALVGLAARSVLLLLRLVRGRPRIVYCTTSAAMLAAPLARAVGTPKVIGHLQEVWTPEDRRALTWVTSANHQLIATSAAVRAALPVRLRPRATIVGNGSPAPANWRPLAGRAGPLHFVVGSRWTARKGYGTLLAAWDRLAEPGRLTILGGPPPGGHGVDVPAIVDAMRHRETVSVVGEVADIGPYLDVADVAIVPSDEPESFGLVVIEAFALGRPVIASSAGGLAEIVEPGRTGWLFAPGRIDELENLLAELTRADIETAGQCARRAFTERFTNTAFRQRWRAAIGAIDGIEAVGKTG
jgi:glycosyltransferase involved in cell wall biosynthesis